MLRVAHVLNSPGRGGVPRVAHALVRHSDPAHIASHVFYLKGGSGPDLFDDIDIPRRVAASSSKATAMTELVAFLENNRIDILHSHSFRPNLYARMAGAVLKPAGLRMVAHYHNDYTDKWHGDVLLLEQRLAGVTDAGVAVSEAVAEHVNIHTGLRCTVVNNGIDIDRVTGGSRTVGRAALGIAPNDFVVGLIGRVCRQKGIDTFVDAACRIIPHVPACQFLVVGDTEDAGLMTSMARQIEQAELAHRIQFTGHRNDIADVLSAMDLVVAPSRWEGFGLSLAEAMAAGVPVLASHVGGIPSVVGLAGELVPAENVDVLVAAIRSLMADSSRRNAMCFAGRRQVEQFDWTGSANRIMALYDQIGGRS